MSTASVIRLGAVASTQAVAFDLAAAGAPDGTLVVADTQTDGRGRRGRAWWDEPGASLLASILVRPRLPLAALPLLGLAAGVAVAEALDEVAPVGGRLKWPNDVLVGGRKVAGILVESRLGAHGQAVDPAPVAVIGIGVNLAQRRFPPELAARATSVALATGRDVDRDTLLGGLGRAVQRWRGRLEKEGFGPIRARWCQLSDTLGGPVEVEGERGVAVDLDADGALLVRVGQALRRVIAGEV